MNPLWYSWGRQAYATGATGGCEDVQEALAALVDRYNEGRPLSAAEKHLVRTELLRAPRPKPSLAEHITRLESRLGDRDDHARELDGTTMRMEDIVRNLLSRPDRDETRRKDLVRLHTITIDSASTVEIDDGLSAEPAGDGRVRVFIHIADPTRYIYPEDSMARTAGARVRTLYLPHTKKPMLPTALGAEVCSLREGIHTPSLTVTAVIRLEDGSMVEGSGDVMMSVTRSSSRLTYEAADSAIADLKLQDDGTTSSSSLSLLVRAAKARKRWREPRAALGAYSTDLSLGPETSMTVRGEKVVITHSSRSSPSRDLVMECMVLAGEVLAGFGRENGIALPYRSQQAITDIQDDLADVPALARRYQLRKYLLKSNITASPSLTPSAYSHHALGVPAYVQGTSPIRRYVDLLAHWQVKSFLRGDPCTAASELQTTIHSLENANRTLTAAERAIDQAFLCAYIAGKGTDHAFESCTLLNWLNQERGIGILFIPELGRELVATINRPAAIGDGGIRCKATHSDPFTGNLHLTCE